MNSLGRASYACLCGLSLSMTWPTSALAREPANAGFEIAAGYWSRDMRLPKRPDILAVSIGAEGRWSPSDAVAGEISIFAQTTTDGSRTRSRFELRRGYVSAAFGKFVIRAGRQIDVWGRADRLNPTDSLSPRDFTTLSTIDDDQRLGLAMARADFALSDSVQLSAYWIPEFRANKLLIEPPGSFAADDRRWDLGQFALKYDVTGGAIDWSLSYYQGRDRVYDLAPIDGGLAVQFNTIRAIGADMSTSVGGVGLRGEVSYVDTVFDATENPLVRKPELWMVGGVDQTFGSNTYLNIQASFRYVVQGDQALAAEVAPTRTLIDILRFQQDKFQIGASSNIRRSWDDQRWTAELLALHFFQRRQGLLRFELRHKISSNLRIVARVQKFYGDDGAYFGRIAPASSAALEVRGAL